jgi:protein-S-isoprenylcysteine O-methyltransferase Ste14
MGVLALLYGVVACISFYAVSLYFVPFVGGDMLAFVDAPKTLDWGNPSGGPAVLIDLGLLVLFGVQHSVMARQSFKKVWARIVPPAAERSTYVLAAGAVLVLLYWQWRPLPAAIWRLEPGFWSAVLVALFFIGLAIAFLSTFLINHFELLGLQQIWRRFRGSATPEPVFRAPLVYRVVRHPIYLGFILALWSTPTMTVGHLLFAAVWTVYILIGVRYEERDLIGHFGQAYVDYKARVPMIVPFTRWS